MYCHNCGKQMLITDRHCLNCGAQKYDSPIYGAEKTISPSKYQDSNPQDTDEYLFMVRPALFSVAGLYFFAALMSVVATVLVAYAAGSILWVGVVLLLCFAYPLYQHLQRNRVSYRLKSEKIEIEQGLFSRSIQNLALSHINNISIYQSLTQRLLGIGNVLIDSAGTADKIALRSIRNPRQYANLILSQLQRWK